MCIYSLYLCTYSSFVAVVHAIAQPVGCISIGSRRSSGLEVIPCSHAEATRPLVVRSLRTLFQWVLFYYLLFWSKVKGKTQTSFRGVDTFLKDTAGDSRHLEPFAPCTWSGIMKWKCIWILWSKFEDFFLNLKTVTCLVLSVNEHLMRILFSRPSLACSKRASEGLQCSCRANWARRWL